MGVIKLDHELSDADTLLWGSEDYKTYSDSLSSLCSLRCYGQNCL